VETTEIDGKYFHAQSLDGGIVPVLCENGEMIPKSVCICYAHSDSECCCGAWSGYYDEGEE